MSMGSNDEKLIELVQAQKAIYDKTDIYYTNKDHVKQIWKDIAMEMNYTVPACQKRWRYLRDYFVRQLHMTQKRAGTARQRKRPLWSLFDKMSFLKPFSTIRRSRGRLRIQRKMCKAKSEEHSSILSVSSVESSSVAEFNSFDYMNLYQTQYAPDVKQFQYPLQATLTPEPEIKSEENYKTQPEPVCEKPSTAPPKKRKKTEIMEELLNVVKKSDENECDEHVHFFKSLLSSVRKIDEEHIMAFRTEILQIIMKYRYMSQGDKLLDQNGSNSDVIVIDTGEMHWRRNLSKY